MIISSLTHPTRWLALLVSLGVFLAASRPLLAGTPSPIKISPSSLPALQVGASFNLQLSASGGTAPYAWSLPFSALPAGLALDPATGLVTGSPTAAGNQVIFIRVKDAAGITTQRGWNVNIAAAPSSGGGGNPGGGGGTPATFTVTLVNGTTGGAASAKFAPYATVAITANAAPAGQAFKQWNSSVNLADSFASSTTFQMPSADVTLTAAYYTPVPIPTPVAGHPRLWLNQSDLPRLRSWAQPNNALYQQGLRSMLTLALHAHNLCFPNGQPAVPYPDAGDNDGYAGANVTSNMVSEQHALTLAFFALVDPDASARLSYAQKARDLFMYVINEAAKGHQPATPFRDPIYAIYNRSNSAGECWPLLADWLQGVTDANGQPVTILNPADRATIRSVFMLWAEDCLNAYTTGGDHPSPIGVTNSPMLLPGGNAMRIAANNYYLNHARLITMMPLALDAADDQPLDANKPVAARGNSLRSYLANATGAWLYQQFAMFGDPAEVRAAFNLPATASVGLASGGSAPEGGLYGHSIAYLQGQLLALQTAGITDPSFCGPQISLLGSATWDRYVHGFYSMMVPKQQVDPSQAYLGPVYQIASIGDLLRLWVTPDNMATFALLALSDQKLGRTTHLNDARWIAVNAVEGGSAGLISRMQRPYNTVESILYFMLFDPTDPTALNPADPRPARPATFIDPGMGRLLARTDWSPNATLFDFRSGWSSINHQNSDAGQFQFYRKGEWLTKEFSSYDNNTNGQSSVWHNTLGLRNWCSDGTPVLQHFEASYFTHGSQFNNHMSVGDPVTALSSGPGYAYASTDLTKTYNRPSPFTPGNALLDIQHASRAIVWLQPDTIVVYDRAASLHAGLFKRFNLTVTALPTIDGTNRRATVVTPKGQYLFVNTLQPANATLTYVPVAGTITNIAGLEPSIGRLVVEDPTNPTDTRFLHVLQAADQAGGQLVPTALTSAAGNAFTGAIVGHDAVLFSVNYGAVFTGTIYSVPTTVTQHHLSGLTPGAGYDVVATSDGVSANIAIIPGGAFTADSAGLLVFDLAAALQ